VHEIAHALINLQMINNDRCYFSIKLKTCSLELYATLIQFE